MEELNLPNNLPWLEENTIILAPTGSHAYGTATEDSDTDYKGVCIPPVEYYLGLESFNEYNNTGGKNFKNTKDDIDVSIIHISKFVKDAMQGVPNNIEILFLRPEDYIKVTPLGQKLIDNRHLFLSKQIKRKFGGFANSQIQKLKKSVTLEDVVIEGKTITEYRYDTKFFMHSVRLLTSAIEILMTGDFSTFRTNREFLLRCRNGEFSFDEAVDMLNLVDEELQHVAELSKLPDTPDYHKINNLLMEINREALKL